MNAAASLTSITSLFNFAPGLKTKAAAVAALILSVIAAWNTAAPSFGLGECHATLAQVAEAVTCATDYTIHVPDVVNTLVLALLGVGAANSPTNVASKSAPTTQGPA